MTERRHMAISVDVDRFSDRKLRGYLSEFRQLGCVTPSDIRVRCAEARARGFVVFPPCDHVNANGTCAGHPVTT